MRSVVVRRGPSGSGLLQASWILVAPREARLSRGRRRSGLLGAQGLRIPQARPFGFGVQAHPPEQSWVPKPVLNERPFRILRRDSPSRFPGVRGCVIQGRSERCLGKFAVELVAGQAALGSGRLRGRGGRVSQTSLQHGLELQNLGCVVPVVSVARLDDGTPLLRVLNQLVPVLIFLETEKERQLLPQNTHVLGKREFSAFRSEQQ